MMKKKIWLLICLNLFVVSPVVLATEIVLKPVTIDIKDKSRLQRGAKLYMNYCSGCHSLKYMRYNRMAEDLNLTGMDGEIERNLINNLIFTQATPYEPIVIAMPPEDAKQWFGVVPPDLSLSARERGEVWLYNYLKSFYNDNSRPFGVNNLLVPNVAMPNVLEPLIGQMILVADNKSHLSSLLLVKQGQMPPIQVDGALEDLVTFLVYVGEPNKLIRYRVGIVVIIFLGILFVAAYLLNRAYWRHLKH